MSDDLSGDMLVPSWPNLVSMGVYPPAARLWIFTVTNLFNLEFIVCHGIKAEKCFGLHVQDPKPSDTRVVYSDGQPSKYLCSPLLLNFSEETGIQYTMPFS